MRSRCHGPALVRSFARCLVLALLVCSASLPAQRAPQAAGTPIGFAEEFALADDRAKTLAKLIPGTDEHYYFTALLAQHEGRFDDVTALMKPWQSRHGWTPRLLAIENRQVLLTWARDSASAARFLQQRLGLGFGHARETQGVDPDLPTRLDPALLDPTTLTRRAFERHSGTLSGFTDAALAGLAATDLDANRLRDLLRRLRTPDVPNLAALVVKDLDAPQSEGFGSLPIHRQLFVEQLEECVRLRPALLEHPTFVEVYLVRLRPAPDVGWERDATLREAYLTALESFTQRLGQAHNSLKAHVQYHRLAHDLALGRPDEARFRAYLRLPRRVNYMRPEYLGRFTAPGARADLAQNPSLGFPVVGDDEPLVRAYLEHFFVTAGSPDAYAELVRADWLRRVFAEAKILAGVGDMQQWYAMLADPSYYEKLRDRVEIRFAPTVTEYFAPEQAVALDVDVKNVDTLLVKVFRIHTLNHHRETGRDVDASIDLDGIVANEERTLRVDEPPLRRVRRNIEFPSIRGRGVWIVELIGNGISSRAVVRKGHLRFTERAGAAGQVFRVLDETGALVVDASVVVGGREFAADASGEIVVPYSTDAGRKPVILRSGAFSSLATFAHLAERYELAAAIHVERETLLPGERAPIVVRPSLRLNGRDVVLSVLEEPVLTVRAVDHDGIETSLDVPGIALFDDKETVHEIHVPEGLAVLRVALRGRTKSLSTGAPVELSSEVQSFEANGIDATPSTSCALLGRTSDGYVLDVLGKDGESKSGRAVRLTMSHRDYTDPIETTLRTDERGRIVLGALPGIVDLTTDAYRALGPKIWTLRDADRTLPSSVHGVVGETLRVPWPGLPVALDRSVAGLFEVRAGAPLRDCFDRLALVDGFLELRELTAGDYRLRLGRERHFVDVRVSVGPRAGGWIVGTERMLEAGRDALLQIVDVSATDAEVRVRLANVSPDTRVHVVATRYLPPYSAFEDLRGPVPAGLRVSDVDHDATSYHSGRSIGDEYRYILDRRLATKYPGNMLARPGLLLNPWAREEWSAAVGIGGGEGGRFGGSRGGRSQGLGGGGPSGSAAEFGSPGTFPNLSFLPSPARLLTNRKVGTDGTITIPRAELGDGQHVHVVAVDRGSTVYRSLTLAERPLTPEPQRLAKAFDPARRLAEKRRIEFVAGGASTVVADARTSKVETYDSLTAVHRLFRSLTGNEDLATFAFVLRWPTLPDAEKRALYAKHACHELHFFLYRKDRPFFDAVVRPYLVHKLHKTFLDEWLLELDLRRHLEPWQFARLNVVERILLAQRVDGERAGILRAIGDAYDLLPPDVERVTRLFRETLKGDAMNEPGELAKKVEELRSLEDGRSTRQRAEGRSVPRAGAGGPGASGPVTGAPTTPAPSPAEKPADTAGRFMEERKDEAGADKSPELEAGERDAARRGVARELYRAPETTRAFVEHNWWHVPVEDAVATLIPTNAFWRDYAMHAAGTPFVSPNFAEAAGSFAGMLMALAVLDLPFTADAPEVVVDGASLTLRAKTPLLVVRQDLAEAGAIDRDASPILVSQNFYRLDERFRFVGNERRDAYVTDEFVVDVAYGCQVVVTNPTSTPRRLELLLQIPQGALPVQKGFFTRGVGVQLDGYATKSIDYAFYFPGPLAAPHYPVHVSADGALVAAAAPVTLNVVPVATRVDTTSWQHVSQNGSDADVLAFLERTNVHRLDVTKIAWRMRDRAFFAATIDLLRKRHAYVDVLWSYGLMHRDEAALREYLGQQQAFVASCGSAFVSPLLTIDPVERRSYQHVEFEPLWNGRAHRFGQQRTIQNPRVASQYLSLLDVLCHRSRLDDVDWLSVTYHLLLQDRVEEALSAFAKVDRARVPAGLQYDYLSAFVGFFTGDLATSRRIATQHAAHPVERWRQRFGEVLTQLDEIEGKSTGAGADDPARRTDLAATEPALEVGVEARKVTVRYRNVTRCEVSYHVMDVEFLFSTHPFVGQGSDSLAFVHPNRTDTVALPAGQAQVTFDVPAEFANRNVVVEVRSGGITRRQAVYANALAVRFVENYGQLQVTEGDAGKPLSKVYVKVFARVPGGAVRFHKDGYTDLRGRFDYASLSGEGAALVERFAVLVLSEERGAVIREVEPPVR
jgi:hypothetical protein